ncbi:hypothetical protein NL108_006217 [Boleophthalmus pectinirostris]|nr:hypothetical protein NL108_006217 [Boleophthalmus pectinirostris]
MANLRFDAESLFRSVKVLFFKTLYRCFNSTSGMGKIVHVSSQCIVGSDNSYKLIVWQSVPSDGFGASFHFTTDLNFFKSFFKVFLTSFLSVSSHTQQFKCKDNSAMCNSKNHTLFQHCYLCWGLCDTLGRRYFSKLVKLKKIILQILGNHFSLY